MGIINNIPKLLREKKISLSELSRTAKITPKTAVKLYYSDFTSIGIDTLDKLCTALNAQPGDILKHESAVQTARYPMPCFKTRPAHPNNQRAVRANAQVPAAENRR